MRVKRYADRCCAVVVGRRRGPKKHSKVLAVERFKVRGLIARDKPE